MLNDEKVDSKQLFAGEVLLLEACHFSNLLSDGATLNKGLLVDLIDLYENLRYLAKSESFAVQKLLQVAQEQLLVELSVEE